MRAYLAVTAALFGLLAVAHVVRVIAEWPALLSDTPARLEAAIGVAAAALCVWAVRLLRAGP